MKKPVSKNIKFSQRELDVLACIFIGGRTSKTTAQLLNVSPRTVETHINNALMRCGCVKSEISQYLNMKLLRDRYDLLMKGVNTDFNSDNSTSLIYDLTNIGIRFFQKPMHWKDFICVFAVSVVIISSFGVYFHNAAIPLGDIEVKLHDNPGIAVDKKDGLVDVNFKLEIKKSK